MKNETITLLYSVWGKTIFPMENNIRSIFDEVCGGSSATDGNYYIIKQDHKTKELYAITIETNKKIYDSGRTLEENESAIFYGEKVRGMSQHEEILYNMDIADFNVDMWGNIEDMEE